MISRSAVEAEEGGAVVLRGAEDFVRVCARRDDFEREGRAENDLLLDWREREDDDPE